MNKRNYVIGMHLKRLMIAMMILFMMSVLPTTFIHVNAAVKISSSKITIAKGTTYTLKISGTTKEIKWTSSNKSVATVNTKGKITAKKKGSTNITAFVGGKSYICKLTVKDLLGDCVYGKAISSEANTEDYTLRFAIIDFPKSGYKFTNPKSFQDGLTWMECDEELWGYESSSWAGLDITSCYLDGKGNLVLSLKDKNKDTYKFTYYKVDQYKKGMWTSSSSGVDSFIGEFKVLGNVAGAYKEYDE